MTSLSDHNAMLTQCGSEAKQLSEPGVSSVLKDAQCAKQEVCTAGVLCRMERRADALSAKRGCHAQDRGSRA